MQEKQNIGSLFDRIAHTYDGLNHLLSLNIDKRWRRIAVRSMQPAEKVFAERMRAAGFKDIKIRPLTFGITTIYLARK